MLHDSRKKHPIQHNLLYTKHLVEPSHVSYYYLHCLEYRQKKLSAIKITFPNLRFLIFILTFHDCVQSSFNCRSRLNALMASIGALSIIFCASALAVHADLNCTIYIEAIYQKWKGRFSNQLDNFIVISQRSRYFYKMECIRKKCCRQLPARHTQ